MEDNPDDIQRRSTGTPGSADDRGDLWRDEHLAAEVLAEYQDGPEGFSLDDRADIETHLAGCEACRSVLAEMRALVSALRGLPEPHLRCSLALTEEMLEARDRPVDLETRRRSAWRERQIAAVRYATAAAAVLFVLVLGADLLSNTGVSGGDVGDDDAAAPQTIEQSFSTDAAPPSDDAQRNSATPAEGEVNAPLATPASAAELSATPAAVGGATATSAPAMGSGAAEPTPDENSATIDAQPTEELVGDAFTATARNEDATSKDEDSSTSSDRSGWRTLEFGLVLLLAWLLAALVILPRTGARDSSRE